MKSFAALLDRLVLTPGRNDKIRILRNYLETTPDPARGLALAAVTRDLELKSIKSGAIREMANDRFDPELFAMSYDFVGDLAETVSLLWPTEHGANTPLMLEDVVETLNASTKEEARQHVERWMEYLSASERWALLKLVTGGLRIGVSARLAKQVLADMGDIEINEIEEIWYGLAPPYEDLFAWLEGRGDKPTVDLSAPFRPVMLAHPLVAKKDRDNPDAIDPDVICPDMFAFEWKWDGIRVQAASENGTRRIYTRTGEDISHGFPDVIEGMSFNAAIDGELLVRNTDGGVAPFNDLQKRINRKAPSKKLQAQLPAFIRAYDILSLEGDDLRGLPFRERRKRLETFVVSLGSDRIDLSPQIPAEDINALDQLRAEPPTPEIEGVMLKRWDSVYVPGRPKGQWYKWKRDPYLIDAVLMYAQRGHGRRSGQFSDFTFGVWRNVDGEDQLAPVGKAYFGFTDDELKDLNAFIKNNTIDRFGPVTSVAANKEKGLVLEVAFEGIHKSPRHKSGVAMRFPRIHRIRWDKPAVEADKLEALEMLIKQHDTKP